MKARDFFAQLKRLRSPGAESNPAPPEAAAHRLNIGGREVPLLLQRNDRSRRYRLYLDREGQPHVTIPRGGTKREALEFVARHTNWLAKHLGRAEARPRRDAPWQPGTEIYFRGLLTPLRMDDEPARPAIRLGADVVIPLPPLRGSRREEAQTPAGVESQGLLTSSPTVPEIDLRPFIESHLWTMAEIELRARTKELAAHHAISIVRVTVRAQASRWGSSSRAGTISLNWRLLQTPDEVRDYVILHELMHQREMNHSARFWAQVEAACPAHESCRRWLKEHGGRIL